MKESSIDALLIPHLSSLLTNLRLIF